MCVDIKDRDKRKTFLYFLEGKDYSAYHFTREFIKNSELPFNVDIAKKKFTLLNKSELQKNNIKLLSLDEAMKLL